MTNLEESKNFGDNFYFFIAVHNEEDNIPYDKFIYGKDVIRKMAKDAFESSYRREIKELAPKNLDRLITFEEEKLNQISKEYAKTSIIRGTVFAATVIHIFLVGIVLGLAIFNKSLLLVTIVILLALLGCLAIPLVSTAGKQIAILYHREQDQSDIVNFLHVARRELKYIMLITP